MQVLKLHDTKVHGEDSTEYTRGQFAAKQHVIKVEEKPSGSLEKNIQANSVKESNCSNDGETCQHKLVIIQVK